MTGVEVMTNGQTKLGSVAVCVCPTLQQPCNYDRKLCRSAEQQESREEVGLSLLLPFTCNTCSGTHTHTHILLRVGWRRWWVDRGGGYHPLPVEREREGFVLSQSRSSTTGRKDGRK
jgi:hypothetical protein